jgi:hypothetical protein
MCREKPENPMNIDPRWVRLLALGATACALQVAAAAPSPDDEIRAAFDKFVEIQNAHDARELRGLLADSPQFLWITRGNVIWGKEAAMQRFTKLYEGTWKLEPEPGALRVVSLGDEVAELHVPVVFTAGAAGQPPQSTRMFLNQVLVKSGGTWRVMSIFPVAAP